MYYIKKFYNLKNRKFRGKMLNLLSLNAYQQVTYIFQCIQFIIVVIGVIGNIFVFIVFSRPNLKKHSYSFYCRVMVISDIGVLIYFFKNWVSYVLEANLDIVSPFFCSISRFILYLFGGQSTFIIMLITADRMLNIVYSNRFAFLKKRWFQWLMVFIGIVYNVSVNSLSVIYIHIVEIEINQTTTAPIKVCYLAPEVTYKQAWIILAFFIFFNIIINNILNVKIVWFMVSSRRNVARNSTNNLSRSSVKDRKFAITSIGFNLSFMVLKLPFIIALIVMFNLKISFDVFIAIQTVVYTIALLDHGFSFLINFFLNSIFHDEFLVLIGIKKQNSTQRFV